MMGNIRLEFLRRIMSALIKISKGNTYLEKLETSYKTIMVALFLVIVALVGIFVKYIELEYYAKDAETSYVNLMSAVNEINGSLKTIRNAYDDNRVQLNSCKFENKELIASYKKAVEDLSHCKK